MAKLREMRKDGGKIKWKKIGKKLGKKALKTVATVGSEAVLGAVSTSLTGNPALGLVTANLLQPTINKKIDGLGLGVVGGGEATLLARVKPLGRPKKIVQGGSFLPY